jgi:hypothetical protein
MAKPKVMKVVVGKGISSGVKLTKSGQHPPKGNGCLSTSKAGHPCRHPRVSKLIPYCKQCMKCGDPSLKAVQHPRFGKILIAIRNLPKRYYVGWWGKHMPRKELPQKRMEWALQTKKGMIDAVPFPGSLLKFSACPGPNEVPTIDFSSNSDVLLKPKEKMATLMFSTLKEIPKNHQLTMMYNADEKTTDVFFKEQGITRADVGTSKYPALRKKTNTTSTIKTKSMKAK